MVKCKYHAKGNAIENSLTDLFSVGKKMAFENLKRRISKPVAAFSQSG